MKKKTHREMFEERRLKRLLHVKYRLARGWKVGLIGAQLVAVGKRVQAGAKVLYSVSGGLSHDQGKKEE